MGRVQKKQNRKPIKGALSAGGLRWLYEAGDSLVCVIGCGRFQPAAYMPQQGKTFIFSPDCELDTSGIKRAEVLRRLRVEVFRAIKQRFPQLIPSAQRLPLAEDCESLEAVSEASLLAFIEQQEAAQGMSELKPEQEPETLTPEPVKIEKPAKPKKKAKPQTFIENPSLLSEVMDL